MLYSEPRLLWFPLCIPSGSSCIGAEDSSPIWLFNARKYYSTIFNQNSLKCYQGHIHIYIYILYNYIYIYTLYMYNSRFKSHLCPRERSWQPTLRIIILMRPSMSIQFLSSNPQRSHRPSKRSNIINNPIPLTINTPLQTMVGLVLDVFILGRKMAQAFGVFKIRGKGLVIVTIRLKSPVKIKIHHNPHQVNGQNPHVQSC